MVWLLGRKMPDREDLFRGKEKEFDLVFKAVDKWREGGG